MVGVFPYAIGVSVFSMIALFVYSTDFDLRTHAAKYADAFPQGHRPRRHVGTSRRLHARSFWAREPSCG